MREDGAVTRIVAGSAGGRRIEVPPRGTRPTSDRVREAVFSALEAAVDLEGARVLDLYAGSGALGLEALSRGAGCATFVEADRRAAQIVRRNAESLGFRREAHVEQAKAETALAEPPPEPFDVVFADPPYDLDPARLGQVLRSLATGWTAPGAVVVLEQAVRAGDPPWPEALTPERTRRYGDTAVHWASA